MCNKAIQGDIKRAACQMIKDSDVGVLNITRLSEVCGISRMTFYANYKNIDELLEDVIRTELERIADGCLQISDGYKSVKYYITQFAEFSPVIKGIYGQKRYESLVKTVSGINQRYIRAIFDKKFNNPSIPTQQLLFFVEFFSSGLTTYLFEHCTDIPYNTEKEAALFYEFLKRYANNK